jgi:putative hemolysin
VSIPNPAAVFCVDQAGEYLLDSGECRLPDGSVVNAWEYYRETVEKAE